MRRFPGVTIGVVTDRDDPAGQGRVKLSFPWMSDDQPSGWAPIAAPIAGKQRGHWFMPEVGDEALVSFELGDFAHPFVVGFLWNGVDQPPATEAEHRVLVTPGGHELRFEDKDGAKRVVLKTSGGHTIELHDANKKITITSAGASSITIDDTASSITLKGGGRELAMSGGQVTIK